MKSIVAISLITFVLIFGGVVVMSGQLGRTAAAGPGEPELSPQDYEAAERVFQDMAVERDRIQQEKEAVLGLGQKFAVQEKILKEGQDNLALLIQKLELRQKEYGAERDQSAVKLAKMYEAMKAEDAAPILSGLDPEIVLDIMVRMKERQAAKILARMDPALAAEISTRLSAKGGA